MTVVVVSFYLLHPIIEDSVLTVFCLSILILFFLPMDGELSSGTYQKNVEKHEPVICLRRKYRKEVLVDHTLYLPLRAVKSTI